jgi:anti-sigma B factor antagonist
LSETGELVQVRLLNLPVQLQRETSEHHDALIREFTLIKASSESGSLPQRLITLMDEIQERYRGVATEQRTMLQDAIEEGLTSLDLTYAVPPAVAPALAEAGALLTEADEYCRAGRHLVTLATPPLCAAFREWFIDEFVRQVGGAAPQPWSPPRTVLTEDPAWPTHFGESAVTVTLKDELDLATSPALRDHLNALHLAGVRNFVLDTSGVTFVDSVGLSVILALYRRCTQEGGGVTIVSPSSSMKRTLEVAGLYEILDVVA